MEIRYFLVPETCQPHLYRHGVVESEVKWVLMHADEDIAGSGGTRQALGKSASGRHLRVIYVPDE